MLSGYRGGTPDTEVIANLHETPFYEAHKRLVAEIARLNEEKLDRLAIREPAEQGLFICAHCLERYRKVPRAASRPFLPILTSAE
jgi:hypothetical protein